MRTMEEISWGVKVLFSPRYSTSTAGLPPWSTTLKGQDSTSFFTMGSSKRRPIKRLLVHQVSRNNYQLANVAEDSLDIEDGVLRVHGGLVLGGLTDQALLVGERNERGSSVATLVVGN